MRHLMFALAVFIPAGSALAQDATACASDADCPDGQACAIADCGPSCDPDDPTCVPSDCGAAGVCIDVAEPPPPTDCLADSDCAEGEACITQTIGSCSACACPDDGDNDPTNDPPCDCAETPDCTEETFSFCGPRYLDGCTADADCGPGFACEAADDCACTVDDSGAESCDCAPSTDLVCVLQRVECTEDSDCADGLVCVDEAAAAPCAIAEDGTATCDNADAAATTRICAPEAYAGVTVEAREDDIGSTDDDDSDAGENDGDDQIVIDCSQSSGTASLPFFAFIALVGLGRRRR